MKKIVYLSFFLFVFIRLQAQNIQPIQKTGIITPYLGFSDVLKTEIRNTYELPDHKREQLRNTNFHGSIGIGIFYFINNNVAVGGELNYTSATMQWKESSAAQGGDSTSLLLTYRFNLKASRIRMLARLNYYFAASLHNNWYLGFGAGYNHTFIRLDTDSPYRKDYDARASCFFPLSARTCLGFNHYFTKDIGLNAEIGIGGPLASIGITGRF